jgi:hypothetical protein
LENCPLKTKSLLSLGESLDGTDFWQPDQLDWSEDAERAAT